MLHEHDKVVEDQINNLVKAAEWIGQSLNVTGNNMFKLAYRAGVPVNDIPDYRALLISRVTAALVERLVRDDREDRQERAAAEDAADAKVHEAAVSRVCAELIADLRQRILAVTPVAPGSKAN